MSTSKREHQASRSEVSVKIVGRRSTTNPIESTFATVRLREGVTKGAGSRTAGLTMAFKLLQVAEGHWRCIDAAELVPLVRAGVAFEDGVQIEPQKKRKKAVA